MNNNSVLNIYGDYKDIDVNYMSSQDYFVHQLRFNKLVDMAKGKNILDIGCGKYTNLLKALCLVLHGPRYKSYIGIDICKCEIWRPNYSPIWCKTKIYDCMDFTNDVAFSHMSSFVRDVLDGEPVIITCFEVLEHMDFEMQNKFLYNLSCLLHDAKINVECCMFSTPNFNGSAARNHISELNYLLLEEMFERYSIRVLQAQGLSVWQKFWKAENLLPGNLRPNYTDMMPLPLAKMLWGAALPRQFSNNILYFLESSTEPLHTYSTHRNNAASFRWEGYRQGGEREADCFATFCLNYTGVNA